MTHFEYTLNFKENSANLDKYYNIYYENKKIASKITFPYTISFYERKFAYNIIVENDACGSKKNLQILGQYTTVNFTTQSFPSTNPIFIRPTTTIRLPETTSLVSTTTVSSQFMNVDSVMVINCSTVSAIVFANTLIKLSGNYSGNALVQITNTDTNKIFRKFDAGVVEKDELSINLPIGTYKIEIKDYLNETIKNIRENVKIVCPSPTFDIEYISNNCGKYDAKLRIYNIKNANKFRYCFGETFICASNFNEPDAILEDGLTEVIINLNTGAEANYTNGSFIVIRGFNFVEHDYTDIKREIPPCTKPANSDILYLTSTYKQLKITENGSNVRITINLLQNGKKTNAPTDISVSGYYTISLNGTYVQQKYDTIIEKTKSSVSVIKVLNADSEIFDSCIENIEPTYYLGTYFQNNSLCS